MSITTPVKYMGKYFTGGMTNEQIEMILSIREQEEIPNLTHMLFDFPSDIVAQAREEKRRPRDIIIERGEKLEDYLGSLRKYQTVGTAFMYFSPRSIIADGCGLGKTSEVSALVNLLKSTGQLTKFLMAVETSAVEQTVNELMRFTGLYCIDLPADAVKMRRVINKTDWRNVDGIIIKHSTLRSDTFSKWLSLNLTETGFEFYSDEEGNRYPKESIDDFKRGVYSRVEKSDGSVIYVGQDKKEFTEEYYKALMNHKYTYHKYDKPMCKLFNTFLFDESSVIKNSETKTYRYTMNICNIVERVHMMNATAFETNIMDIYYQMDMMNDKLLPKKYRIDKEFCTHKQSVYWTKVNGVPKKNFRWEHTGYKNQSVFKDSLKLVYFGRCKADVGLDLPHIYKVYEIEPSTKQLIGIEEHGRYSEVLNCPSLVSEVGLNTNREDVPKLDRLCTLIENEFSQEKVMVFCFHLEAQAAIKRELEKIGRKCVTLNGGCVDEDRYAAQKGFNDGTYDVIITNIKKSLNLYGGDVCIFYSVLTNPAAMFQAASRIDRNVDDKLKTFVLLLYKNSPEYDYFRDVVGKRAKDARDLTIDAKTTVDYFYEAMLDDGKDSE